MVDFDLRGSATISGNAVILEFGEVKSLLNEPQLIKASEQQIIRMAYLDSLLAILYPSHVAVLTGKIFVRLGSDIDMTEVRACIDDCMAAWKPLVSTRLSSHWSIDVVEV